MRNSAQIASFTFAGLNLSGCIFIGEPASTGPSTPQPSGRSHASWRPEEGPYLAPDAEGRRHWRGRRAAIRVGIVLKGICGIWAVKITSAVAKAAGCSATAQCRLRCQCTGHHGAGEAAEAAVARCQPQSRNRRRHGLPRARGRQPRGRLLSEAVERAAGRVEVTAHGHCGRQFPLHRGTCESGKCSIDFGGERRQPLITLALVSRASSPSQFAIRSTPTTETRCAPAAFKPLSMAL
jgi:hypothetical protein